MSFISSVTFEIHMVGYAVLSLHVKMPYLGVVLFELSPYFHAGPYNAST